MKNEPWSFYSKYAMSYRDWKYTPGVRRFQTEEKEFLIANVQPGLRVIDIGCGPGEHIASILDKQAEITAVDFVQEMIDIANEKVGDGVRFICADINDLSFPRNYFDYGICYCTLPNQEYHEAVFDKISFYSKSLVISVYNWDKRFEVAEFYTINGLHPELDDNQRTIFLGEGLRYIFIPEETVLMMYKRNGYQVKVNECDFGNIYYGVK